MYTIVAGILTSIGTADGQLIMMSSRAQTGESGIPRSIHSTSPKTQNQTMAQILQNSYGIIATAEKRSIKVQLGRRSLRSLSIADGMPTILIGC